MDSSNNAFTQFLSFGRKRRHTFQTTMSPWTTSSRIANPPNDDMNTNLYGNRRISNSESCVVKEEEMSRPRRKRNTGKLEPIKSYLRLSNVEPRHSHILPRLEHGDEYTLGNLTIGKSATYQVTCEGDTFKGFQHIFLDDKSTKKCQETFYNEAVKPLVGEFVNRHRNICIVLHGAEGSGRQRALFGDVHVHPGDISRRSSSRSRHGAMAEDEDDLSSLGCDGVSDVHNQNFETDRRASAPPIEVSFKNDLSSCCSKLGDIDSKKSDNESDIALNAEDGILPRMLADTFNGLGRQYPSLFSGRQNSPQLVPKNRATPNCRIQALSEALDDDGPNVTVEFYTGGTDSQSDILNSAKGDGLISLRISCIEVVDDLASGECTINDLLDYYKVPDDEIFLSFGENEQSNSSISASNIKHEAATGLVYVEDIVEMQCQTYVAAIECLTMAEESRQTRNSCRDAELFTDKLHHTVYIINIEQQDERTGETTISHQMVISRIDESMSNSASLALHSSYLALSNMIDDIAKCPQSTNVRHNALAKLLGETIGGECCTIAIGTINAEDDSGPQPTLRLGEAMSWMYNTTNTETPKAGQSRTAISDRSIGVRQSLKSQKTIEEFVPETNNFDGPKRLSQSSKVPQRNPIAGEIATARNEYTGPERTANQPTFIPAKLSLGGSGSHPRLSKRSTESNSKRQGLTKTPVDGNFSKRRIPTKSSQGEDSSRLLALSLGSNSYCSFSMGENDLGAAELTRSSFVSGALADSDNPFVKQYAKELNKSWASRSSIDLMKFNQSDSAIIQPAYDPVKDAKSYLAEIEAMENQFGEHKMVAPQAPPAANRPSWQDMSNEIESNIEAARKRMMDRMREHSMRKPTDYTMDLPAALPHQGSYTQNRFPPEYVSVELSSHGSSERHQMAMDDMEETYRTAVADMQEALRIVQAEKDELIREKSDNYCELEKAREDINRLKSTHGSTEEPSDVPIAAHSTNDASVSLTLSEKPKETTPIRVMLRVRALNKFEQRCRGNSCINVPNDSNCTITSPFDNEDSTEYSFDKVFGAGSPDQQIYSSTAGVCLPKFMSGVNCWILLYGLACSGKSYTLDSIIPRFSKALFQEMRDSAEANSFTIKCSAIGLYLEQLYDLLNPQTQHSPFLNEPIGHGINIVGASEPFCFDEADVEKLFQRCNACRDSLSRNMNLDLNYFHTFFIFTLEQSNAMTGERNSSKMWFANIAASHSVEISSRKTEARIFQRSLGIVSRMVDSLNDANVDNDYRSSKLSSILRDAFVGGSFTTSVITASPSSLTLGDTLKALKFGKKMQRIKKTEAATTQLKTPSNDVHTDELKSKFMSIQSEMLVWRKLADSLTKKTLEMEHALNQEKQKVEMLAAEKIALEQERMDLRSSRASSLNAENYSLDEMQSALTIFDDNERNDEDEENDSVVEHEVETKSVSSKASVVRIRKPSFESSRRKQSSSLLASMTTSAGMSSLAEIEEAENIMHAEVVTHQEANPVDLSNVDAFYFMKEIEESYPKMNILRGLTPFKYDAPLQEQPTPLRDKGLKS